MNAPEPVARIWTAAELRRLPEDQRSAILADAAELAEADYTHDPELTAFEAFGADELYGDSANDQPR
jgi:hypothetical protein